MSASFVWRPLAVAARVLAGLAALVAVRAFAPRAVYRTNLPRLRQRVAATDAFTARELVVDSQVVFHEQLRRTADHKIRGVRVSLRLLATAIGLAVSGAIVELVLDLVR